MAAKLKATPISRWFHVFRRNIPLKLFNVGRLLEEEEEKRRRRKLGFIYEENHKFSADDKM